MKHFLSLVVASLTIVACGGGKEVPATPTQPPPPSAPVPATSLAMTLAASTVFAGSNTSAIAIVRDAKGNTLTGRTISWSSSSPSVASVSASGAVVAIAAGTTNISATVEGLTGMATLTVLPTPVATVSIQLTQSTVAPGRSTTVTATARDATGAVLTGRQITYSSSLPSVAVVSVNGIVQTIALGTATITATSEGRSASALLTVQPPPIATVTVTGASRVKVGDPYIYSAVARLADGTQVNRPMTWSVKEPASVSVSGGASAAFVPRQTGAFTVRVTIDGEVWETPNTAYDWESSASNGSQVITLAADNLVTNRLGASEYPSLIVSCSNTGRFSVWVSTTNIASANGLVSLSFDGASPISQTWDLLGPNSSTLSKTGSNGTIKALATQIASARTFTFAFNEFSGSNKTATFRVGGLQGRLPPLMAQCASDAGIGEGGASVTEVASIDVASRRDELVRHAVRRR